VDPTTIELVLNLGLPLFLLIVTYFIGTWVEARHYRSIHASESGSTCRC
jgi:hypothetical protein